VVVLCSTREHVPAYSSSPDDFLPQLLRCACWWSHVNVIIKFVPVKGKAKKFYKIAFCAVRSQPQVDDEWRLLIM